MSNYTYINASTVAEDPHAEDDFVRAIQRVTATLYETFPIVFLIFGTLGNTLSFAVLTRKTMRKNSTTLYLAVLAVTDLAVLWLGLTRHAAIAFQNKDVRLLHSSLCKLQRFFLYFSLDYSAWILVAVTAERCFSVYFPLKSLTTCTRKRAAIALACIATAMALKNAHVFLSRGLQFATDGDGKTILVSVCGYPSPGYKFFWSYVLPWIVFLVYALGPFLVILVHNLLIIRKVIQLRKKRETMIANSGSVNSDPTPAAVIATSSRDDGPNSQETAGTPGTSNNIAAPSNEGSSYQKRVTQMTVMSEELKSTCQCEEEANHIQECLND
ncbi:neuromedin-U receptor 1-like [Lingula anatina]|uniref:Neuromedin-U receptor 1-like n=1 Tax=Lingula anatina TaxID=7574 RepID=A0A1S3JUZ1_LINAN|nr:neuromedin-U receptor 1-like [Lingula anatina]|eukprot:XP_013413916.1 neuromedin-U receptor 1-like [Lingula anatina]